MEYHSNVQGLRDISISKLFVRIAAFDKAHLNSIKFQKALRGIK